MCILSETHNWKLMQAKKLYIEISLQVNFQNSDHCYSKTELLCYIFQWAVSALENKVNIKKWQ